jgi:hypothetical protein
MGIMVTQSLSAIGLDESAPLSSATVTMHTSSIATNHDLSLQILP